MVIIYMVIIQYIFYAGGPACSFLQHQDHHGDDLRWEIDKILGQNHGGEKRCP